MKWYILPHLIIDRDKYKGKGRPKKEDYRIFPDKNRDLSRRFPLEFVFNDKES